MRVVFPIVPSFKNGELDLNSTYGYIKYIQKHYDTESPIIMTTAGTSQFNLLKKEEIIMFNETVVKSTSCKPIIGIPAVSYIEALEHLLMLNKMDCYPMLLYPDRFYTEDNVCSFFERCAEVSKNPIYIHGMWMRKGNGGSWDYTASVINRLAKHNNIMGMKEETSSIDLAFEVLSGVEEDFDIIVAGGSMNRHEKLVKANGNISFLSGVGSIFPQVAKRYADSYNKKDFSECSKIMDEFETPLFEVFMEIGWHPSLRYALYKMEYIRDNRFPFIELNGEQKDKIDTIISELKSKIINE